MNKILYLYLIFSFAFFESALCQQRFVMNMNTTQPALLQASAGDEIQVSGSDIILGGAPSAQGGLTPYLYQWIPEDYLNDPSLPNPIFSGTSFTEYLLLVTDSRGCISSDSVQILITSSKHISSSTDQLLIFPNPTNKQVTIIAPREMILSQTTIYITDQSGKTVLNQTWGSELESTHLGLGHLSTGKYFIQLNDGFYSISSVVLIK